MNMIFLAKTNTTLINTPKKSKLFLILLHFPGFFSNYSATFGYGFFVTVHTSNKLHIIYKKT